MTAPNAAMIFAAGLGTRMRPLTDARPKAMVEVAGKPLIDHALHPAEEAGIPTRVVNLHWFADLIRSHLSGRGVTFSDETGALLETGGGLRKALPLLGPGPVFAMNADAVWSGPNPYEVLREAWDPTRMDGLVLLVPPERAHGHALKSGFGLASDGRALWQPDLAYPGAQILTTGDLSEIDAAAFSLRLVWDRMRARDRLFGVIYPGHWCDVGYPDAIPIAEAMLECAR